MTTTLTDTPTLAILSAVNGLYKALRTNFPDVPPATIVLGAKGATKRGQTHGHFHAGAWKHDEAVHEIMLSGESLERGAEATLGTLIHEAAHAVAHVKGIQDTSNNGRYHNAKFRDIAEGMGITLEKAPTLGYSKTTLSENTATEFKVELDVLRKALVAYKLAPVEAPAEAQPRKTTKVKVDCLCETPVSVSIKWFESKGDITCGDCLDTLKIVEE